MMIVMNYLGFSLGTTLLFAFAAAGCSGGGSAEIGGLLGTPNSNSSKPVDTLASFTLTGPGMAAPGVSTKGYVATYTAGKGNKANPGVMVELQAAGNNNNVGNIVVVSPCGSGGTEQPAGGGGRTDEQGRVCFNYTAPPSQTTPVTITLSASAPGQLNASNQPLAATLKVMVQPATFQFVPPDSTTVGITSSATAELHFQWTQLSGSGSSTQGVSGKVQLSASNGKFTVDGTAAGNPVVVNTSGGPGNTGDFASVIGVYGSNSGTVNVMAVDQSNGRSANLTLQAVDPPSSVNADASPRQIPTAGSQNSTSTVTVTVYGSNGIAQNTGLTFTLTPVTDGSSEKLSLYTGTTDNAGKASTVYYAANKAGNATVKACVNNSTVCGTTTIAVTAP